MTQERYTGTLFTEDFLKVGIRHQPEWEALSAIELESLDHTLRHLFNKFPTDRTPNESQTEDDLIWPVLRTLGWTSSLRRQNLSQRHRRDVPDGLLFASAEAKQHANNLAADWKRYECGLALLEAKRWQRPLDRRSGSPGEDITPSSQMLHYLRRVDDVTNGRLQWGILTNGARWRLYHTRAVSVADDYFDVNLHGLLSSLGDDSASDFTERSHWLKVFVLLFGLVSFIRDPASGQAFHERGIQESLFYQERVSANLSQVVFGEVFPGLARAVAAEAPEAPLSDLRDTTLILLYRLLFVLYAEDRGLLPVHDPRYDDYALRDRVRVDVGRRKDIDDVFSSTQALYWCQFSELCGALFSGDASIGLPPYNGGLFAMERTPLLNAIRIADDVFADVVDKLSFEVSPGEPRRYINYRDLGVRQLGSIYERLLERDLVRMNGTLQVRLSSYARKDTGSYYTPDKLVSLVIDETLAPLIQTRMEAFAKAGSPEDLVRLDPASQLLQLKVCDPAMGSGHFLVRLVDQLADHIIAAMTESRTMHDDYCSPVAAQIDTIRAQLEANARTYGWNLNSAQLEDRQIVRRLVLKRCVYGVDKNPMAVELAKVSLWLHTVTVGAPLTFLDHHLKCGDSLFGAWVGPTMAAAKAHRQLFTGDSLSQAAAAAEEMQDLEAVADTEIAETNRSALIYANIAKMTAPLAAFLSLLHGIQWLSGSDKERDRVTRAVLDGTLGDPVELAQGRVDSATKEDERVELLALAHQAVSIGHRERFLHWQVAFPGVWSHWHERELRGGFHAIIGNPPWDRIEVQDKEWFGSRASSVTEAKHSAERKRRIARLEAAGDPLIGEFRLARARAAAASRVAKSCGDYPLLSGGSRNLYALFVERALTLLRPDGIAGLLVPSGIVSDKTAAAFFNRITAENRLCTVYDFLNNHREFFAAVHARFKFCVFVVRKTQAHTPARFAFYLSSVDELDDPARSYSLAGATIARVNPNTGTAPVFRNRRDADLTAGIYERLPVMVNRSSRKVRKAWPLQYRCMYQMSADSHAFRTRAELESKEDAWPIGDNRYENKAGIWVPLYEGKMVQAFDHRAADIVVNPDNLFRPGQQHPITASEKQDPTRLAKPRYWVLDDDRRWGHACHWAIAFKDVTAATNIRTMIAAIIPRAAAGHTLPLLSLDGGQSDPASVACRIVANLDAIVFDFVARQKVHGNHLSKYIVEQLPVVPLDIYDRVGFGGVSAGSLVRTIVRELIYTAHDLGVFARDLKLVDASGEICPPYGYKEDRRIRLRAKLDAVYFHLYGLTTRRDVRYIYSTFPILEREETAKYGRYLSCDLCLAWISALSAGQPDAEIVL
ncbi:MAG: Eco57I restriction-modification methylase domain-containing protein [Bacteroidota bacterium]|nr:Eco57I restriction-modification methylase domain-containing protein [Bacteroidota bacterium]